MRTIVISIPDSFTEAQEDFLKRSAFNQIEAEMKATLKVPQSDIDAVEIQVAEVKTAMGITEPTKQIEPEEPTDGLKDT